MTDTELSQLRQNLMAQFQDMMDEDVPDLPDGFTDNFESLPWRAHS